MERLRRALEALDEPSSCEGTLALAERLAIMLPDGDLGALDDPRFVDWIVEHGEPAPYGQGGETLRDSDVRHAIRLAARGAARVSGFDVHEVLDEIEASLSPRTHLAATLLDVLVYPPGGHFVRHKDTPYSADLVGTLIIGLPIAHTGGEFQVEDRVVDWSGNIDRERLPWVAFFGDADHEIRPVTSGARVTLVYSLALTDQPRVDPRWTTRLAGVRSAARQVEMPPEGMIMIACTRHVIGLDGPQPLGVDALRGTDRDVADTLLAAGLRVAVRTCIVARSVDWGPEQRVAPSWFRNDGEIWFARLSRPLVQEELDGMLDVLSFEPQSQIWGDGGGYDESEAQSLAPYLASGTVPTANWIMRRTAAATFMRAVEFSDDGFVVTAPSTRTSTSWLHSK